MSKISVFSAVVVAVVAAISAQDRRLTNTLKQPGIVADWWFVALVFCKGPLVSAQRDRDRFRASPCALACDESA